MILKFLNVHLKRLSYRISKADLGMIFMRCVTQGPVKLKDCAPFRINKNKNTNNLKQKFMKK